MGSWDMSLNEGMNETFNERYNYVIENHSFSLLDEGISLSNYVNCNITIV